MKKSCVAILFLILAHISSNVFAAEPNFVQDNTQKYFSKPAIYINTVNNKGKIKRAVINHSPLSIKEVNYVGFKKKEIEISTGIEFSYGWPSPGNVVVHNQLDWGEMYSPAPTFLELPPGIYDVWGIYYDKIVVIENIKVTYAHKATVRIEERMATHKVKIIPKDQFGAPMEGGDAHFLQDFSLFHDVFPTGLCFEYVGFPYIHEIYLSDISDNYTVSNDIKSMAHNDFFSLGSYVDTGVYSDIIYENDPNNFKDVVLHFKPTPYDLQVLPPIENNPWVHYMGSVYFAKETLPPDYIEHLYIEPQPKPFQLDWFDFTCSRYALYGGLDTRIFATLAIGYPDEDSFGLYTAYFLFEQKKPYYHPQVDYIPFGLGPEHFRVKFQVENNTDLMPYPSYPDDLYLYIFYSTPTGEERRIPMSYGASFWERSLYELYKDGYLIKSGNLLDFMYHQEYIGILDEPALYQLVIRNDNFFIKDQEALNKVSYIFDTRNPADVNPPYFYSLQVVSNEKLTETILSDDPEACLQFYADDDIGVNDVLVWYNVEGLPQEYLEVSISGNKYTALIPSAFLSEDKYVSITIDITDGQGNKFQCELTPAFFYDIR